MLLLRVQQTRTRRLVLQKAMEAKIITMGYDSITDESGITWAAKSVDYKPFAEHIWDNLVQFMGDSGDYAVLTGQIDTPDHTAWFTFGTEYAAKKYPNLKLVTERIPTNEVLENAYNATNNLLDTYPNLKGIVGLGLNPPGAAKAIRERNLSGKVAVVGTSLPQMSAEYLKDGSMSICTLYDPKWINYCAVYIAKLTLEGKTAEVVDGMQIPGYDFKLMVDGKNIVTVAPLDFTAKNVDEYGF